MTLPKLQNPPGVFLSDVIYAHNLMVDTVNGATDRLLADAALEGFGGIGSLSFGFDEWASHYHRFAILPAGGDPAPPAPGLIVMSPNTHSFDLDGHPISIYIRNDHASNDYTFEFGGSLASLTLVPITLDDGDDYFVQYVHTVNGPLKLQEIIAGLVA